MDNKCKKCLLLEAGEEAAFKTVSDYLSTVDPALLADDDTRLSRLEICKNCEDLISGMCLKCGCYVEIRASLKDKACSYNKW